VLSTVCRNLLTPPHMPLNSPVRRDLFPVELSFKHSDTCFSSTCVQGVKKGVKEGVKKGVKEGVKEGGLVSGRALSWVEEVRPTAH
jgi:hypothetical protein